MIKSLFILTFIVAILTGLTLLIPQQYTDNINNSFVYFLGTIGALSPVVHIQTIYTALQIFGNFLFAIALFYGFRWILTISLQ